MRYAVIKDFVVVNKVEAEVNLDPSWVLLGEVECEIGDLYNPVLGQFISQVKSDPAPPAIPASLTPRQFRQALTRAGLRLAVEAAIAAADSDTQDWYNHASSFERSHAVLLAMATTLGATSEDVDNLFLLGSTL